MRKIKEIEEQNTFCNLNVLFSISNTGVINPYFTTVDKLIWVINYQMLL